MSQWHHSRLRMSKRHCRARLDNTNSKCPQLRWHGKLSEEEKGTRMLRLSRCAFGCRTCSARKRIDPSTCYSLCCTAFARTMVTWCAA